MDLTDCHKPIFKTHKGIPFVADKYTQSADYWLQKYIYYYLQNFK